MINQYDGKKDVVTMARNRVRNAFATAGKIFMSVSGGKDSICLNDIVYNMCKSGEIDKSKLTVQFIDEEAIYPCIERIAKNMRTQWLMLGVEFNWYCLQVKHFNCLNALANDESFICWDETKRDVWIRERPKWAITSEPFLDERRDTYQQFLDKKNRGAVRIDGVRMYESIQRREYMAMTKMEDKVHPIYDWRDTDVWRYISERNLDFPEVYMYMYQCGTSRNRMRVSQFFSIDTVGSLVKMCEYYPGLFDRICKREPNAYLAMLYYDTEMFRRSQKSGKQQDNGGYREKVKKLLSEKWRFEGTQAMKFAYKDATRLVLKYSLYIDDRGWRDLYKLLSAGDPKHRTSRALESRFIELMLKEA